MCNDISILVVDDDPDMLWVLNKILTLTGYRVTTALNGADALACLQEQSFALALIDMKLPMMDGLQLAGALKVVAPTIVIILISGYYYAEDPEIEKKLDQNFCAGFIAKPFDVEDVRSTIRRVLR
jgi:DNA-binding NtrC family response regulator